MSGTQRDDNLGIDSDLRNTDPAEYDRQLRARLTELDTLWGDDNKSRESSSRDSKGTDASSLTSADQINDRDCGEGI